MKRRAADPGPSVHVKLGLANRKYNVSSSSGDLSFTSAGYSGILIGTGAQLPIGDRYGVGFDINLLTLASYSESPVHSGDQTQGASAWDLSVRGYYALTPEIDLSAKLVLEGAGADFVGRGNRPAPGIVSSSQSRRALIVGASYYF